MSNLRDRLSDPNERFSPQEMYQLFELLAEEYGFHRDPNLPPKDQVVETSSLTVEGFEHLGVLVVRPRTVGDQMLNIPNKVDALLGPNMRPSQNTQINASLIALAQTVIISPVGFVDDLLKQANDTDLGFFIAFATEYKKWMDDRAGAVAKKKPGKTTGKERSS